MATPQKLRCRVENIVAHGEHVYTLVLIPAKPPVPRFKPGQFLHLALDPYDPARFWPESRVFSIASSPSQRDSIQITYSVRGKYTARMEQEIAAGCEVWVKMPYGEFTVNRNKPAVLIAGGTGITAFTSLLSDLDDNGMQVTVLYGARHRELLIYRPLVEECVQKVAGVKASYFLENDSKLQENEFPGKISILVLQPHIMEPLDSNCYLSGPPQMLKSITSQLHNIGVPAQSIFTDAWE